MSGGVYEYRYRHRSHQHNIVGREVAARDGRDLGQQIRTTMRASGKRTRKAPSNASLEKKLYSLDNM